MRAIHNVLTAGLLLCLLAAASRSETLTDVRETRLPNGLTVLTREVRSAPIISAQVWFRVGSRDEQQGKTGVSHLLEHMLFNTSKNFKKGEISRLVRLRGGVENAATYYDYTMYYQLLPSENLEFSLKALAERVGNALLLEDELKTEKGVVLSELRGRYGDPVFELFQQTMTTAMQVHPYRWPVGGWIDDVQQLTPNAVREYYRAHYSPANATLVLIGDFDTAQALSIIRRVFNQPASKPAPRRAYQEPRQNGERTFTLKRMTNLEFATMAWMAPAMLHPDAAAMTVLNQILAEGKSSRLYKALVDTQLALQVNSISADTREPSPYVLMAVARPGVSLDKVKEQLTEQIEQIRKAPPTEEELSRAKRQLEAELIFARDSITSQGQLLGQYSVIGDWRKVADILPSINKVTADDVQRVAKTYLAPERRTTGHLLPALEMPAPQRQESLLPSGGSSQYTAMAYTQAKTSGRTTEVRPATKPYATRAAASTMKPTAARNQPVRYVLPNGLVLIMQRNGANPTVAIRGAINAGSAFDPAGKNGVAEFTAELSGRGTTTRSAAEFALQIEQMGASLSVDAGEARTVLTGRCLARDIETWMELLADQLRNPVFPAEELDKVRNQTLAGLQYAMRDPDAQADRTIRHMIFPAGHPYHRLSFEDQMAQTAAITREDLVAFHNTYWRPDLMSLVIVGDIDPTRVRALVERHLGDWKAEGPAPKTVIPTINPQGPGGRAVIPLMERKEVTVKVAAPSGLKRSDPDYYAASVMNFILGGAGAMGSLLGKEIREKQGLVYDIYSTFEAGLGAGPWLASMGTGPDNVDKALASVKSLVRRMQTSGATRDEMSQAVEQMIGLYLLRQETNQGVANGLLDCELYQLGLDFPRRYASILRALTPQQIQQAARKYLAPDSLTVVISGPYQEKP